jgi:hypothetical protein
MEVIVGPDLPGSTLPTPDKSLAYIGNASARMRVEKRGGDPRRFRLGDEKEGAGAADAVIYQGTMGVE